MARVTDLSDVWADSDPVLWRRAASDWRALWVEAESPRRGRQNLAEALGYATASKVDTLAAQGRRLREAAGAGDADAAGRLHRAERLGRLLATP